MPPTAVSRNTPAIAALAAMFLSACGDFEQSDAGQQSSRLEASPTDPETFTPATAAAKSGRFAGAAVAYSPLIAEAAYRDVLGAQFNAVTPENATKWGPLQPNHRKAWDFAQADAIVDFAVAHGQSIKGHAFVWHNQLPPFITEDLSGEELLALLDQHIKTTLSRYGDRVDGWDVVNEAVADDGSGLRDTIFSRKLGPDFIEHAFHKVRAKDRNAKLYYNDYSIEGINAKSNAVYELVKSLVERDTPIDGVGFQGHFEALSAPSLDEMVANVQRFTGLGLRVNISELDVRVAAVPGSFARKLAVQKQVYQRVAAACLQTPGCEGVTSWGFTDKHSWIDSFFGADDPLPFDEQYQKKPAYFGLVDGFIGVPLDDPELSPNLIGNSTFEAGLDGWSPFGSAPLAIATDQAHTGLRSGQASGRSAAWQGPQHDILGLVSSARTYDVSVWARIDGASSDQLNLTAQAICSGAESQFLPIAQTSGTDTGWVRLSGALAVPSCDLQTLAVYVEGPQPGVTIYVDDLALRERELGSNIVSNSTFESGASGWFPFGPAMVNATTTQAHSGTQSGVATARTATWMGIATDLRNVVVLGASYEASLWARIGGSSSDQLVLTAKITCSGEQDQFVRVASATGSDAQWVRLSGPLAVPNCTLSDLTLYVEGPQPGVDIYIDDVLVQQQFAASAP
jgi:GH35 family endo-1,4-beta-xylanase